jgi:hypothetical protein
MDPWHALLWGLTIPVGLAALYGLHRFALGLEARGQLYYKHRKPTSSAASCLMPWQEAIEPTVRHVIQIKQEQRHHGESEAPGQDGLTAPSG